MPLSDTSPEIEAMQSRILDAMTEEQRVVRALELCHLTQEIAKAGLRHRHPDWSEQKVSKELLNCLFEPGTTAPETTSNTGTVFIRITNLLREVGIPHMLVGSFACACYGWIRSALDVDFVISCNPEQIKQLSLRLQTMDYQANITSASPSFQREPVARVFDMKTGWKIDLTILQSTSFEQEAFCRRRPFKFEDRELFVTSPEDLVIAQLKWSGIGGSFVQIRDAATVFKKCRTSLDHTYLKKWLDELGLAEQWHSALREANIQPG